MRRSLSAIVTVSLAMRLGAEKSWQELPPLP